MRTRKAESILRKWGESRNLNLVIKELKGGIIQAGFHRKSSPREIQVAGVCGINRRGAVVNLARSVFSWANVDSLEELELKLETFGRAKMAIT